MIKLLLRRSIQVSVRYSSMASLPIITGITQTLNEAKWKGRTLVLYQPDSYRVHSSKRGY